MARLGPYVLVGVAAFALSWFLKGEPAPVYRNVEVPVERIIEREPDTVVRWRERIVYRNIPPAQVATATGGATEALESFCRPVTVTRTDTVEVVVDPQVLLRSVRTDPGWFWGSDDITMTGITNVGDLKEFRYSARPGWNARTVGDSLLVRSPRFGILRPTVELGAAAVIGWLLHGAIN